MTHYASMESPLGEIVLRADEHEQLSGVFLVGQRHFPALTQPSEPVGASRSPVIRHAAEQLAAYFSGERFEFELPLAPPGTAFQQRVWQALRAIPWGTVTAYGMLAEQLSLSPGHARAVGGAVGRNPLSIIVPCHRVLAGSGRLGGYAGGLERKRALLTLEGVGLPADTGVTRVQASEEEGELLRSGTP
ncbi:methylated-DNA-[protein]-cysteine S-methyltransferase [Kushneria sinocarnis]|uniref:Methylated-DNA--protein-cysteine methyltransferase n=1 Tax=Kushneria sinocarnis TaxID=595502 RepID=A0A420WW85_9GAMM|nr:methylated-DNA--[protein]-cysteine S-methyltransferase [Kushneria sinocarnis]RKR03399.1 methylated-DNA-[protein]-cysteine S-methyltransferase [Kushneria sinocarnis]